MKCLYCLFLFSLCLSSAKAQQKIEYIAKTDFVKDVEYLIQKQELLQVDAYKRIGKKQLKNKVDSLIATLSDSIPRKLAFTSINYFTALYNDGHVYVEDDKKVFQGFNVSRILPLTISSDSLENIYVTKDFTNDNKIGSGAQIRSINGHSASVLFGETISLLGGLLNYRINENNKYFAYNLYLRGYKSPYIVNYIETNSVNEKCDTLEGIPYGQLNKLTKIKRHAKYSFKLLENNIGYLDFRAMYGGAARFKTFLDSCFAEIKKYSVKGLIVDLRYNSGGDSELGYVLLSYLTDKRYRLSSGRDFKVSNEYQEFMRSEKEDWNKNEYDRYQNAPVGKILHFNYQIKNWLASNINRTQLKTCFLVGPGNFSSATMLADGAQNYKIATLIGQPTGAPANGSGEVYTLTLPNSGFIVSVPVSLDIRANGNKNDLGPILPDIYIRHAINGNQDVELEFAKKWVIK